MLNTFSKMVSVGIVTVASLLFIAQPIAAIPIPDSGPGPAPGDTNTGVDSATAESICKGAGGTWNGTSCSNGGPTLMAVIGNITNILLFVTGAISVLMIIIGGIRYVTSSGEQAAVTGAKNTILYAVIGLVVTFTAYAIVNFVIVQIFK